MPEHGAQNDVCGLDNFMGNWKFLGLIGRTPPTTLALCPYLTILNGGYHLVSWLIYTWAVLGCRRA
jgi:hypothetical protein